MKSTGVVRKLDALGRIVLPKELRNVLAIKEGDDIEFLTDRDMIILRKRELECIFCGSSKDVSEVMSKQVCGKCRNELASR